MADMTKLTERERTILNSFPVLTKEDLEAANNLFEHYIFYKYEPAGRQFWASCCQHEELVNIPPRTSTPELRAILFGGHKETVSCPWCGKKATLWTKGLARSKYSEKWHPQKHIVYLHADEEGNIFAQAYWLEKDYIERPCKEPYFCSGLQSYFEPGRAIQFYLGYGNRWSAETEEANLTKTKKVIEPFSRGGMYPALISYSVRGLESLEKSFARYCGYKLYRRAQRNSPLHSGLLRFLTVASIYPRQLEMLVKTRQYTLITDLMYEGKKNCRIFNWNETDPRKAFGLSGTELKEYLLGGDNLDLLKTKKLVGCSLREAWDWLDYGALSYYGVEDIHKSAKEHSLSAAELKKYLRRFTGEEKDFTTLRQALTSWNDYIVNAQAAGFDLTQRNVLLPRDLMQAHDNAAGLMHKQKIKTQKKLEKARKKEVNEKYAFETEHYLIRAPHSAEEIVNEGRVLRHCVGGYADRYVEGKATILLLREKAHPNTPLCTIQVNGCTLIQIHGFKNDIDGTKPELRFAEIYKPFKRWLDAKCPRNENGSPRVPKAKERKSA